MAAIALAVAFTATNGFHDAADSIAALIATRTATPLQALVLASAFNLLGPLLLGAAVANTIELKPRPRSMGWTHSSRGRRAMPPPPIGCASASTPLTSASEPCARR